MYILRHCVLLVALALFVTAAIPDYYDYRNFPKCPITILNQKKCGSCWSFSGTQQMNLRLCQQSRGSYNPVLSPQHLINCDKGDNGCSGGHVSQGFSYINEYGIPTMHCQPYTSGDSSSQGLCSQQCEDPNEQYYLYYIESWKELVDKSASLQDMVDAIKNEIFFNGPISAAYQIKSDFQSFFQANPKGIYKASADANFRGIHTSVIVGWGSEPDSDGVTTNYWLVANSWGTDFADKGLFKIAHGECEIETNSITVGVPKIPQDGDNKRASVRIVQNAQKHNGTKTGAKHKIKLDDEIVQVGKLMVEERNKQDKSKVLSFEGVIEAETQITSGVTFHLKLLVGDHTNGTYVVDMKATRDHDYSIVLH